MDNSYYIYCYINRINNKKYIGQTKVAQNIRSGKNGQRYKPCPKFWAAIQKYGWDNFNYIILKNNLTLDEANYWEEYYIKIFHTWVNDPLCWGYNLSKGGFNTIHSQETLEKNRISHLKENLSKETLQKMSDSRKQWWLQHPEAKEKLSNRRKDSKASDETKQKMSQSQKQRFSNPEELKKRSELSKKKVLCVETNTIYNSLFEAAQAVGLKDGGDIGRVCSGKRKSAGGYHWQFIK